MGVQAGTEGHLSLVEPSDWDEHYGSTVLTEFKALAATQAAQSERISTRAQQIVGFVVAVFAVAQTAALSSFDSVRLSSADKTTVLSLAIGAAVVAGFAAVAALIAGALKKYKAIGYLDIEVAAERAIDEDQDVAIVLAKRYRQQIEGVEAVLEAKRDWLRNTEILAATAIVLIVGEVIVALATRI